MAAFCIRPDLAEKLKEAARSGAINIEKMYSLSSADRRALFEKYVDPQTAKGVNAGFEKAMASEQQSAIAKWVKDTFTTQEKKSPQYNGIITKVNDLNQQGLLTPDNEKAFLQDIVSQKLGATVTPEEAKQIAIRSDNLQAAAKKITTPGSFEDNPQAQIEYFKAQDEINKYVQSLTPNSNLKVFTGTFGRAMMVATIHSPFLNVESHTVEGFLATAERRLVDRNIRTLNNSLVRKYMNFANKVFDASEYDLSRFEALGGDKKTMGEDVMHSQGPGPMRKLGRLSEQLIFKNLHGKLYQRFAAFHFADSANLKTTAIAYAEGLTGEAAKARANELFKDATSLQPKTPQGKIIRAQAQADALRATFTNKSIISDTSLQMRKVANTATGDYRIGDLEVPFAKIPANVLGASLDYAGISLTAKLSIGIAKTLKQVVGREPFDKENFADVNRYFVRAGLGLMFAYAISSLIKPTDFIGAYPTNPTEKQLLSQQNGVANSIRVGNKWISLDYLAVLSAPLLGFLYAKKYGSKTPLDYIYQYGRGATQSLENIPGLQQIANAYTVLHTPPTKKDTASTAFATVGKQTLSALTSRIVPGLLSDIAKMTDPYQRAVAKTSIFAGIQKNIPGLRQGLPIKRDLFGTAQKTEPWLSTFLFGSRVKTVNDSKVLQELVSLDKQGALPSITDISTSSTRVKQLKTQIGPTQFNQAMQYFGKNLKQNMLQTIESPNYQTAQTPQDKQAMLNKAKEATVKQMLSAYGYVKPLKVIKP